MWIQFVLYNNTYQYKKILYQKSKRNKIVMHEKQDIVNQYYIDEFMKITVMIIYQNQLQKIIKKIHIFSNI